jgi:hypothetical protein
MTHKIVDQGQRLRALGLTPDCLFKPANGDLCLPEEELRLAREVGATCALADAYQLVLALPVPQHLIDLVASHRGP